MLCSNCGQDVTRCTVSGGKLWCKKCLSNPAQGKRVFPFVTQNVDGTPMTINSLAHLRQVEKAHGVSFAAFQYDEKTAQCAEDMSAELRKAAPPKPKLADVMQNPERFGFEFGGHRGDEGRPRGIVWPNPR